MSLEEEFPELYSDAFSVEVPDGWLPLVRALSAKLSPGCRVTQAKSKVARLCLYVHGETAEDQRLIDEAETASASMCETCGAPGRLVQRWGWYSTMCDEHARERGAEPVQVPEGDDVA